MNAIDTCQLLAAVNDRFDSDPREQTEIVEEVLLEVDAEKEIETIEPEEVLQLDAAFAIEDRFQDDAASEPSRHAPKPGPISRSRAPIARRDERARLRPRR